MNLSREPVTCTFKELTTRHDLFLFDAYGVLFDGNKALPGARDALEFLRESRTPFFILTNDASKSTEFACDLYNKCGIPVTQDAIISSGMLVTDFFNAHALDGAETLILGPERAYGYVTDAGGSILPFTKNARPDVIVILDDKSEASFHESMQTLITVLLKTYSEGKEPHLLLANPDLIYPSGEGTFNFAAGSIAAMLEKILALQFPNSVAPEFVRVGKPYLPIFEKALTRYPATNPVMIGDQLFTDIKGAKEANIYAGLVLTGVTSYDTALQAPLEIKPDYIIKSLHI